MNQFKKVPSVTSKSGVKYSVGDIIHIKRYFHEEGGPDFHNHFNCVMVDVKVPIDKITIDEETGEDTIWAEGYSTSANDIANKGIIQLAPDCNELFILSCLNISPGKFCPASYNVTESFLKRIQEEPQAAVCFDAGPGTTEGGLVLICGPASDKESMADAQLFAASKDLLVACVLMYGRLKPFHSVGSRDTKEALDKAEEVLKRLGLVK